MVRRMHDPAVRESIRARLEQLRPDSPRKWGKMTADQMLWHLNQSLENTLGRLVPAPMKMPMPVGVIRFAVFNLPWPKGAPTPAEYRAGERHDFAAEKARCLRLIDEMTSRGMESGTWGRSAAMGPLSGEDWSRLQAKHLEHHLKQFGM
jgi:hypothetical protein